MDVLTALGLFAVTAMLVTYALEARSPWWTPTEARASKPSRRPLERTRSPWVVRRPRA